MEFVPNKMHEPNFPVLRIGNIRMVVPKKRFI